MPMTVVSGTVKECRVNGCTRPAKTHRVLCTPHAARLAAYTTLQVGGLTALTIAGFAVAIWLGLAILGISMLVMGLVLEM